MTRYEQSAAAAVAKQHVAAGRSTDEGRVMAVDSPLHTARCPPATRSTPTKTAGTGGTSGRDVDELKDAFQVFDKDRDGFLSATDLRSVSYTSAPLYLLISDTAYIAPLVLTSDS